MKYLQKYELFGGAGIVKQLKKDLEDGEKHWNKMMRAIVDNDHATFNYEIGFSLSLMNLEETDKNGNTALLLASQYGRWRMVQKLVELGANIYHKNNEGKDFYDLACDRFKFINRVKDWIEENYPEYVAAKQYNL